MPNEPFAFGAGRNYQQPQILSNGGVMSQTQPSGFNYIEAMKAMQQLSQQQGQQNLQLQGQGMMAPQTRHLGMDGGDITGRPEVGGGGGLTPDAIWDSTFKGKAERGAREERMFGPGNSITMNGVNPAAHAATVDQQKQAGVYTPPGSIIGGPQPATTELPSNPMSNPIAGGMETPINPNVNDPGFFGNANWGSAVGGLSSNQTGYRSGPTISDETGPRYDVFGVPTNPSIARQGISYTPPRRF